MTQNTPIVGPNLPIDILDAQEVGADSIPDIADRLRKEGVDLLAQCRLGILGLKDNKVILYQKKGIQFTEIGGVELTKFLLFSHQIGSEGETIERSDIEVFQSNDEVFLLVKNQLFYFDENQIDLDPLTDVNTLVYPSDIIFSKSENGVIVQVGNQVLHKESPTGSFTYYQVQEGEIVQKIDNGFLKILNGAQIYLKNPSLAEGRFFQMENFQAQLDEITEKTDKQTYYELHQDALLMWIDTLAEKYGSRETAKIRLQNGAVEVCFIDSQTGESTSSWLDGSQIELQIAQMIAKEEAQKFYAELGDSYNVQVFGKKVFVSFTEEGVTSHYDGGTLGGMYLPSEEREIDIGTLRSYSNIFSQKNTEVDVPKSVVLYSFKDFRFSVIDGEFTIEQARGKSFQPVGELDISLNRKSCTKEALFSFLGDKIEHSFVECRGHLFFQVKIPNGQQIVYRFIPSKMSLVEEFTTRSPAPISIREVVKNSWFGTIPHSTGAGIYLGNTEKDYFIRNYEPQESSTTPGSDLPVRLKSQDVLVTQQEIPNNQFEGFTALEIDKVLYLLDATGEKNIIEPLTDTSNFFLCRGKIYAGIKTPSGKISLQDTEVTIDEGSRVMIDESQKPVELLVQNPHSTEYRGYTFSQEKNLFEGVDAQIDFVGKTQGYTFLRVGNQLFVLKQNVGSGVTIIEQKIPKGMSLDQLRFVDDVVGAAFDAQMQDIDENFQRFYFDPQSCAIDFSKFSSLSYIYYGQKLGDIPLGSIGDTQISRLENKIMIHNSRIYPSKIVVNGRAFIQKLNEQEVLVSETTLGSNQYMVYIFDPNTRDFIVQGVYDVEAQKLFYVDENAVTGFMRVEKLGIGHMLFIETRKGSGEYTAIIYQSLESYGRALSEIYIYDQSRRGFVRKPK